MDISISSHVLDQEAGGPAAGVQIALYRLDGDRHVLVEEAITDADGRVGGWQLTLNEDATLRVEFATGRWFEAQGKTPFYPQVQVDFKPDAAGHYHIPLLLNRHGYTTYRGS